MSWNLNFPNESVQVIQWHGFFSILLICLCCTFAIISTAGKSMIIYFILYKAPKRPMNTMILLDQVRISVQLRQVDLTKSFLDRYIADQFGNTSHDYHLPDYRYAFA